MFFSPKPQKTPSLLNNSILTQRKVTENLINEIDETKIVSYATRLVLTTVFLIATGLIVLYSASFGIAGLKYFQNQLVWVFISAAGAVSAYYIGYKKLTQLSPYILAAVLLLLVVAFFGPEINGARRWIRIPLPGMTLSLQPSELTKIALSLFLSGHCAAYYRTQTTLFSKYGLIVPGTITVIILGAIAAGEDMGTTILVAATAGTILFIAGMRLRYILIGGAAGLLVCLVVVFNNPTRMVRITDFMHPERTAETTGYQLYISKLALGSGGLFGQGFMCSRMKAKYLPEAHTDFILSVVGEEFGYVGIIAILCAYAYFCYLAYQISLNARNKLGMFLGCGLTTFIALQALINLTVIGGLAPTKGMPAPFISYGGTNLLSCVVAIGILLSIASDTIDENYNNGFYKILNSIISLFRGKNGKKSLQ